MPASRLPGRFTNTAVPKFDGTVCWQQHLQVVKVIAKSNGWGDETVALQLFAHLEGETLNVALLMPEGERATWEGLSQGISSYYNSPVRLAVLRRRFDNVTRWEGENPSAFATELEILTYFSSSRFRGHWSTGPNQSGPGQVHFGTTKVVSLRIHRPGRYSTAAEYGIVTLNREGGHFREIMCTGVRWRWLVIPSSPRFLWRIILRRWHPRKLQIPVSVARVVAGGGASAREKRPEPGNYSGLLCLP